MDCDFTEEVSLLVDGELAPHEAARLRAHVEDCAACKQAREAFLLFRQELRSYERAPDPDAQSRALAAILGSRPGEDAAPSAAVFDGYPSTPRGAVRQFWGSLREAFNVRRLRPAHVAALALLLIGTALGLRWIVWSNAPSHTQHPGAAEVANVKTGPVQTAPGAEAGGNAPANSRAADSPNVHHAEPTQPPRHAGMAAKARGGREATRGRRDGHRTGRHRRLAPAPDLPQEAARVGEVTLTPSSASSVVLYAAAGMRAAAADPSLRIGRHAERVERLLRSFRNSRMTEHDPTLDVADARRLSKRLLYHNIALRREAASAGDLPVEGLLDSVEPILIDISNLPNSPSRDAVGSIKERIHRRQLVGALQTRGMLASP
jgi:hypothetical protein